MKNALGNIYIFVITICNWLKYSKHVFIYIHVCVHINFQCFYIFCGIDASREMVMAKANDLHKHSDVSLSKFELG